MLPCVTATSVQSYPVGDFYGRFSVGMNAAVDGLFQSKNPTISPAQHMTFLLTFHDSSYILFFPWNGLKWSISDSQESAICLFTARASKQNEIPGSTPWWVISRFLVYMIFYDAQHLCSKQMQNFFHQVIRHVTSGSLPQWFIPDPTLSELSQDHDSKGIGKKGNLIKETLPAWWFGTFGLFFHILDIIWNNNPTWLIFSRGVEPPTSF